MIRHVISCSNFKRSMNILVLVVVVTIGVTGAQQGDIKDCEPRQSAVSARDVQDLYQRPASYDNVDYSPHSTYGPPDQGRPSPRRAYPQDISEGANVQRPTYVQAPTYTDIRKQFPYAPVYGPPPPRSQVAAAAGIYDDYEDIQYAAPPPPPVLQPVRRYNINYAHREPYQPNFGYGAFTTRYHEYRVPVPVYYAPLADEYHTIRLTPPISTALSTPAAATTTTTTEQPRVPPAPTTVSVIQSNAASEQTLYSDGTIRRYPPIVAVTSSEEDVSQKRRFRKPFSGLADLFRGSIISTRNKIGLIPSIVKGSVDKFTN